MLSIRIAILACLVGLLAPVSVLAGGFPSRTFVASGSDRQSLNGYLEYFEDQSGELTITEVAESKQKEFKPYSSSKKFGYDFAAKALWVRFTVDAGTYGHREWYLTYDYEHIDNLQIFYPAETGWNRVEMDARLPHEGRWLNTTQYTTAIPTSAGAETYYVRFSPQRRFLAISLSWSGTEGLVETTQNSAIANGLFFGALAAIWLYNLALFVFLRDKLYLYYIYYLGCFTATFLYIYGPVHLLWQLTPFGEKVFAAAAYAAIHGLVIFTRHFLLLDEHSKWVNLFLKVVQWVLLAGAAAAFLQPIGQPFRILNVIILVTVPVIAAAGILRSRTYPPARLYSLGWALFALALCSLAARSLNLLSINLVTTYGVMVASVWEAALFSLALGYRVKLSEAQAMEERLRTAEVEREAIRAREQFLSMVSHELRSPLTSVSFGLDMLELRAQDAKQSAAVSRIRRAADAIESQLRDLLTLASGSRGTLEIRPVAFDAIQLVVDVAEERRASAEAKGLTFRVSVPEDEVLVIADPARVTQAISNLIANAIKYTDKGYVCVVLEPLDAAAGQLRFRVQDTGPGIPDAALPLVFKPFSRFESMQRGKDGYGIGLAVVKTVVDHLGGTITIASQGDGGTTFAVSVPVAVPAVRSEPLRGVGRVLVVDDRDDVLTGLAGLIGELGYQVDQALGPAIGANLLAANAYDVVLIDLDMPIKPGRELASETRRGGGINANAWLIAFSAAAHGLEDALWPFNAFLAKPVNRFTLKGAIEAGIAGSTEARSQVPAPGVATLPG